MDRLAALLYPKRLRKLSAGQASRREMANKAAVVREPSWRFAVQADQSNLLSTFISYDPEWFQEVRVLREQQGDIEAIVPSVIDEVRREIDIRSFLLHVENTHVCWRS